MIDDKKIEDAKEELYEDRFLLNGDDVIFDNDDKEEMFYKEDIKKAIGLGAKWGINEFWRTCCIKKTKSQKDMMNGYCCTIVHSTIIHYPK